MMILMMLLLSVWIIGGVCKFAFRAGFGLAGLFVRLMLLVVGIAMIGLLVTVIRFLPVLLIVLIGCMIVRSALKTA